MKSLVVSETSAPRLPLEEDLRRFITSIGFDPDRTMAEPLAGGVSSDIWKIQYKDRTLAIKRALSQLRVQQTWHAPVTRSKSEVDWMRLVAAIAPGNVPEIVAFEEASGIFAMTYLEPAIHPVWKELLRTGESHVETAAEIGRVAAKIHAKTANKPALLKLFDNDAAFTALRVEPYLRATAERNPAQSGQLEALATKLIKAKTAVVHGDLSPKNILIGPHGPIILDAECAWYGDPAFDLAFVLNHLVLKSFWAPRHQGLHRASFRALSEAYMADVDWEPSEELSARAAALLPALLLARVDGRSPVEYLAATDQQKVRKLAHGLLAEMPSSLGALEQRLPRELQ